MWGVCLNAPMVPALPVVAVEVPSERLDFFQLIKNEVGLYVRQVLMPSAPDWMLQKSLIRRRPASFRVKDILASKIFEEALLTETVKELECNFLSPNKSCFQIGQFISFFLLLQRTNRVAASVEKLVEKIAFCLIKKLWKLFFIENLIIKWKNGYYFEFFTNNK